MPPDALLLVLIGLGAMAAASLAGALAGAQRVRDARRPTRWSDRQLRASQAWAERLVRNRQRILTVGLSIVAAGLALSLLSKPLGYAIAALAWLVLAHLLQVHVTEAVWRRTETARTYLAPSPDEPWFGPGAVDRTLRLVGAMWVVALTGFAALLLAWYVLGPERAWVAVLVTWPLTAGAILWSMRRRA